MEKKRLYLTVVVLGALGLASHASAALVAYWNLEEGSGATTAAAVSSPQADGKLVGATWTTTGLAPIDGTTAALFFKSASADRVETSYPGVLGQAARSVTAWIRAEPTQTNNGVMVGWGANTNDRRYSVRVNKTAADGSVNALRLEIQGSRAVATTPLNDRQWHHIAVTQGNGAHIGEVSFYVDGKLDAMSGTAGGALINTGSTSVVLGNSGHATGTYGFDGAMDEVRIYDHALTQAEIQQVMKGVPPGRASDPNPADKAPEVPWDVTLHWTAGKYPGTHDVYVGTAFADVNNAARTNAKGFLVSQDQTATTFDPAGPFAYGQTYYWRVDEVNKTPDNTVFKGAIWSFTVEPYAYPIKPTAATAASAQAGMGPEKTIDGSGMTGDLHGTEPATMWVSAGTPPNWIQYEFDKIYKLYDLKVWNSNQLVEAFVGFGARNVTIEYSPDGTAWTALTNVPEFARAPGTPDYTANTTVALGGIWAKYVKLTIDSSYSGMGATGLSEVQFSYVPVQARLPQPVTAATGVSVDTDLQWRPGREAGSHKVFLGTDQAAVAGGTAPAQTVADHGLTPSGLTFGTTYYWKVEEVNTVTYPGDVWSFTTQEYAVVDDFESYNDDDRRIYDTWIDGLADGKSNSIVGYDPAPFAELTIIHGGKQSMPMTYDNSKTPFYSEAERRFGSAQNWATSGADSLVVYYRGVAPAFAQTASGGILMNAIGTDIWGTADQCRFVHKTLHGNGSLVARVDSLFRANAWSKAGVMIRESLEAGSRHVGVVVTPNNGVSFLNRPDTNQASVQVNQTGLTAPYWVKLTRTGNVFAAQCSADGVTWVDVAPTATPVTVTMTAATVYIGLALTSHDAALATSAEFSQVATTGNVTGAWQVAEIGVTQPTGNSVEELYLSVRDSSGKTKVVQNPDAAATAYLSWQPWKIPLSEFTSAGVKMDAVKSMTIGVGNKVAPKAGGAGMLFIDDIGFGHPAQ